MKKGSADLPLHGGHCPPWLFEQMKELGESIVEALILEFSRREVIRRFSDPGWFQTLGCVLGFDWHSSGLTTVVCGALKEALNKRSDDLGLYLAGGKGNASRKTPEELRTFVEDHAPELPLESLVRSSRMAAQVDSSALQDGYQIYHHSFFLTTDGDWTVIQQGLRDSTGWARRYHWSEESAGNFLDDPHEAVCSDRTTSALNLADSTSEDNRSTSTEMVRDDPTGTLGEYVKLLDYWDDTSSRLQLPDRHSLPGKNHLERALGKLYDRPPDSFADLIDTEGVGPKTTRALSMVAEVVWGAEPSYEDPARYAFAHGGKDGYPYPVDQSNYTTTIDVLNDAIRRSRLGDDAKMKAFERLSTIETNAGDVDPPAVEPAAPEHEPSSDQSEETEQDQLCLDL